MPGLSKDVPAESCKQIIEASPDAKSLEDGYWIKTDDNDGARQTFCLMADKDEAYGGGWTLVARGIGGSGSPTYACYTCDCGKG